MEAKKLFINEYYAWHPYPRGRLFTRGAKKVQLKSIKRVKNQKDRNTKTFALIVFVDTGNERLVRVRELVDFWDNYELEEAARSRRYAKEN